MYRPLLVPGAQHARYKVGFLCATREQRSTTLRVRPLSARRVEVDEVQHSFPRVRQATTTRAMPAASFHGSPPATSSSRARVAVLWCQWCPLRFYCKSGADTTVPSLGSSPAASSSRVRVAVPRPPQVTDDCQRLSPAKPRRRSKRASTPPCRAQVRDNYGIEIFASPAGSIYKWSFGKLLLSLTTSLALLAVANLVTNLLAKHCWVREQYDNAKFHTLDAEEADGPLSDGRKQYGAVEIQR